MRKFLVALLAALLLAPPSVSAEEITAEEIIAFWKKNGITEVSLKVTEFLDFLINDKKLADLHLFTAFGVFFDLKEFYNDLEESHDGVAPDYTAAILKLSTNVGLGNFFPGMAPYKSSNMASLAILFDIVQGNDALFINHQIELYKYFVEVEGIRDPYGYDYCTLGGYLYHKSYVFAPYPLNPEVLTPAKVREIVEKSYAAIYGNTRDEESDARRFSAESYALLEEKAGILQGYMNGSFTDVVLADRLGNGLFINNAGPDTIFRLVLIEKDLLSHDDTIFIGTLAPGGETLLTADLLRGIPGRDFDRIAFVTSGLPVSLNFTEELKPFVGSFDFKTSPADLFPGTVPETMALSLLVYAQENVGCFTIGIDYGDGTTESLTPCTNSGMVSLHLSHTFLRNGWFDINITITNDEGVSSVLTDYLFLVKPLRIGYPLVADPFLQANTPVTFGDYQVTTNGLETQVAWDFDFTGTFSPDTHERFPTTTFLPDPVEFAATPTVSRQVALVVSAEVEGVVYTDTLVQTLYLRKPVYALFSTTPSLGSRNEVYTDTGEATVGFVSPVLPAPDQGSFSFLWDFGDGATATGATASHTFTAGSYAVQLSISDGFYTAVTSRNLWVFSLAIPESSTLVTQLEYFFDVEPGLGNGVPVGVTGASGVSADLHIPLSGLSPGVHRLFLRARDENGRWSMFASRPVVVNKEEPPAHVASLEYYFDQPGAPGSGNSLALTPSAESSLEDSLSMVPSGEVDLTALISLAELTPGVHRIFFRASNDRQNWGVLTSRPLMVTREEPPAVLTTLEYYFDQPGAPGSGISLALTPSAESSLEDSLSMVPSGEVDLTALISLAELSPGVHRIFFRATNSFGLQSPLLSRPLLVTPPPAPITAVEVFIDVDPDPGNGLSWPLAPAFDLSLSGPLSLQEVPYGEHRLFVRAKNGHHIWSAPVSAPFTIEIPRQQLSFTTGWNLFSSYILPGNSDLLSLFQPLIDSMKLIKVIDSQGRSLEYAGDPAGWVNTIGNMLPDQGYKVKMAAPAALTLPGTPATLPLDIPLTAGWNTVGFPRGVEADGMAVIRQLIDRGSLVKVQDEKGNAIENLGLWGGWHNNIGTFRSGDGYRIHVSQPDTLTIFPSYPPTP